MNMRNHLQSGAVAIFSVVFATLLIMIVTVSFMALMMSDQRQSTNNDLSESAYDSALAGVEDAKRLILAYVDCDGEATVRCNNIRSVFSGTELATECDAITDAGLATATGDETLIAQSLDDTSLNQAYTCVRVTMNTLDYLGELSPDGGGVLIPLDSAGGADFNQVRISWFSRSDLTGTAVTLGAGTLLPTLGAWGAATPPVLRASVIQPDGSFDLDDFNDADGAATAFLYPASAGSTGFNIVTSDVRDHDGGGGSEEPYPVSCHASLVLVQYACQTTLDLDGNTNSAYLLLGAIYNRTQYRVELLDSSNDVVRFDGTQPMVDSTGRASDIFRRVESRIELVGTRLTYPTTAVDVEQNFCKTFRVTDNTDDYDPGTCTP